MANVEIIYGSMRLTMQCKMDDKMKDIIKKFEEKEKIKPGNIYYSYNGKILNNEDLTFKQIANEDDKSRKQMTIITYDTTLDIKQKEVIKKSKNIICPECHESIRMDINEYKINLSKCKNGHNIENILLNEFEEI